MIALLLALTFGATHLPQKNGPMRVLVMDLKSDAATATTLRALTAFIPKTLIATGRFSAFSMDELRAMVSAEETRQLIGCSSNAACIAELGGAMGAAYVITGTLAKSGDKKYFLQLQFVDNARAQVQARIARTIEGDTEALGDAVARATKLLVRPVLALKPGTLELRVSQEGAKVWIDEQLGGTTPLQPLTLGGGMHTIEIKKDGFIPFSQDVDITPQQTALLRADLRLSLELARNKKAAAGLVRGLAWGSAALGAAGIGTAIALFVVGAGQAASLSHDVQAYNALGLRSATQAQALQHRDQGVASLDTGTLVSGGLGVAFVAVAIALFVTGDSPSKYDLRPSVRPGAIGFGGTF